MAGHDLAMAGHCQIMFQVHGQIMLTTRVAGRAYSFPLCSCKSDYTATATVYHKIEITNLLENDCDCGYVQPQSVGP
jgi:hypothetical protein